MPGVDLNLIQEIDQLWTPVYPHLAKQIGELYGRKDGHILEIGPFCGLIFVLPKMNIGSSFSIGTFPLGMEKILRQEAAEQQLERRIEILATDSSLSNIKDHQIDLVIFRGAFFFPSLFRVDFPAIFRVLRSQGMAFIGGGFGKYTPDSIIQKIGKRSRELNLQIGKIEGERDQLQKEIQESRPPGELEFIFEGGLWVRMRK
jgi:hypothetical protein